MRLTDHEQGELPFVQVAEDAALGIDELEIVRLVERLDPGLLAQGDLERLAPLDVDLEIVVAAMRLNGYTSRDASSAPSRLAYTRFPKISWDPQSSWAGSYSASQSISASSRGKGRGSARYRTMPRKSSVHPLSRASRPHAIRGASTTSPRVASPQGDAGPRGLLRCRGEAPQHAQDHIGAALADGAARLGEHLLVGVRGLARAIGDAASRPGPASPGCAP